MLKVFLHPACGSVIRNITVGQGSSIVSNGNKMTQLHTYEKVKFNSKGKNSFKVIFPLTNMHLNITLTITTNRMGEQ